ncbi:MAG: heparinase II/III family protein [Planctomycetes bacterium]|nr:heparinase II/III family protein [Planctomycetota bacterium]
MRAFLIAAVSLIAIMSSAVAQETGDGLYNVSLTTLGATAKGSGANFNKDWPAINALQPGDRGGGTIFNPFDKARIDIRLVVPVDIKAIEIVGLDYRGTKQVSGVDIYIEGKRVKHADLPEQPGKPFRVPVEGRGQHITLAGTGSHPIRTLADGKKGPDWGGFARIRVLSTTNVAEMMKDVDQYQIAPSANSISPTSGSAAVGETAVYGQPRQTEGHPCTIWDKEDIEHYQAMLKTSTVLNEQYEGLAAAMDTRMTQPLGVPEPVKDADGNWAHVSATVNGGTHNQLALDIANLGAVYALSGDQKYGEFCKKLLLAYADVYDKYTPGNRPGFTHDVGKCFDQRLGDATWLIQVARGYDLIYNLPSITEAERKHIEDDLLKAAAKFIAANRATMISATNWSAISTCSVLITGYATDDQELIDLAMYGTKGTKEKPTGGVTLHFSEKSIDADGMWTEGAMGYQFMALEALVADAEILWHHGIDMYRHRDAAFKRLFDSPLQYSYPDLKTPAIHDSGHGSIVGHESFLYEFAYRRYRDPKYLLILNQAGMHLDAQFQQFPVSVLYDRDPNEKVAAVEWKSVNFFGVGYGVLRNTDEQGTVSLLLDYGPNRSHGHPDKLNVDLWAFGDRLIPDPGSIWYEQPLYRRWYHPTLAHNTLCVDELEQRACGADQLVYGPADSMSIQRARTNEAYSGIMMDRAVFLTPDYMADLFGAFARLPRKMDLCWHIRGEFSSDLKLEPTKLPEPRENGYCELDNLRHTTTDQPWSAAVTRDGNVARFVAAGGAETEVIVGDGHLGLERPPTILQRRMVDSTLYGNAVDFSGSEGGFVKGVACGGSLKDGYGLLTVQTSRGDDLCFASYRPGAYTAGGLTTDAQQAYVLRRGDAVQAAYLGGGTTLKIGDVAIERDSVGLAYVEQAETGAFVVGNPSPEKAVVTLTLPAAKGMQAYSLDVEGKRTGKLAVDGAAGGASLGIPMGPVSRVELAPAGVASVYEHRQAMLAKRQAEQEAAMRKAENEAKARTAVREAEAKANPAPAGTMIVVQAEDFTGQGGGNVGISDKKREAIGKAFASWDAVGHWLEWTVEAPADGYYNLTACFCTALALCERQLKVNGEVQEPFAPLVFPTTGGWANGSDDWRLYTAPNPVADHPLLIKLKRGENVIRLTNTNGRGVNMDYLVIHSPDVKVTREMVAEKAR